jgi:hypothetical protein
MRPVGKSVPAWNAPAVHLVKTYSPAAIVVAIDASHGSPRGIGVVIYETLAHEALELVLADARRTIEGLSETERSSLRAEWQGEPNGPTSAILIWSP